MVSGRTFPVQFPHESEVKPRHVNGNHVYGVSIWIDTYLCDCLAVKDLLRTRKVLKGIALLFAYWLCGFNRAIKFFELLDGISTFCSWYGHKLIALMLSHENKGHICRLLFKTIASKQWNIVVYQHNNPPEKGLSRCENINYPKLYLFIAK